MEKSKIDLRRGCILLGLVLSFATAISVPKTFATTSTSYTADDNFPSTAEHAGGASLSYRLTGGITWRMAPIASTNYQIVPDPATSSSSSATSSTQSSVSRGGGYRPRVPVPAPAPAPHPAAGGIPSSSSSSSSLSSVQSSSQQTSAMSSSAQILSSVSSSFSSQIISEIVSSSASAQPMRVSSTENIETVSFSHPYLWIISIFGILLGVVAYPSLFGRPHAREEAKRRGESKRDRIAIGKILFILACSILLTMLFTALTASAATTTSQRHVYNGHLLSSAGTPITTAHTIRFSYWKSADAVSTDITATGSINTGATNYASWQETDTVTPDSNGYFSVQLGSGTALPSLSSYTAAQLQSLFLQVEVKASTEANTSYEILDVDANSSTVDRSPILSVPFALNADLLDQHDTGTGSGNIVPLGSGGLLPIGAIPGGTNRDSFVLDSDNTNTSTGSITLTFGTSLAKMLTYDVANSRFNFNASLRVQGNLTVTGLINGVDVKSLTGALRTSSGGGLTLRVAVGSYRLNGSITNYAGGTIALTASSTNYVFFGSGGLTKNTTGFPSDESFLPIAEVVTSTGSITSLSDRRTLQSDDRDRTIVQTYNPAFEKASYQGDGTSNVGQLTLNNDTGSLRNFYAWSSTRSTLQDYDILLRVPVSSSFTRWRSDGTNNPLSITYRSTSSSSANNTLAVQVYDTAGSLVTLSGSVTSLASTSWATTGIEFTGSPTWTAGQDMLIRLKVSAKDNFQMQVGALKLQYVDLAREQ